jgi:glycosyltransferase involved in cell wall biosynthesis
MRVSVLSRCSRTLFTFRRGLIRAALGAGHEVTALGAGGDGYDRKLAEEGIDFRHLPIEFRSLSPWADLKLTATLYRYFRRTRPDVCHAFTIKPAIFGTLAAALARVPVRVVTITGLGYAFTSAGGLLRAGVEFLYRVALARAHVVFFQNPTDRQLFIERGLVADDRAQLVAGSGVDTKRFQVAPLPCASGAAPTFLMIGRLLRDKGVLEYLEAARLLRERIPGARCLLLGGEDARNPSRLAPEELTRLRASRDLELLAEVDDVRPVVARADVVVLPSYREGLPRSLLEGGAMGRALIATDVPGCRDVVRHEQNGLLVKRADAESLATAMIRLCENPFSISAMGVAARADIEARFDEQRVIDNTLATYQRLYAENAKNAPETPAR